MNEPSVLAELAKREPDDLALEDDTHRVTWAELDRRTHAIGRGLLAAGASSGDHVGLVCSNRTEFVEVMLACFRAGLKMTPIKTN
ncbi:MAG: AMP-binding protein, partial [bacterium]|nr:AMP-binding protein [bacterium]